MPKSSVRTYSRYSLEAIELLGQMIKLERIQRKFTAQEMATRLGISRSLLQRIEKGDPGCSIGVVFEAAAITGIPLFEMERSRLASHITHTEEKLTLLPKTVRRSKKAVKDDF